MSGPATGAHNMALDDAISEAAGRGEVPPTMRFYSWEPPCLSIGQAQKWAEFNHAALASQGWNVVRRPSGGRAVLHRDEVTYAIAGPESDWRLAGGVLESYARLSEGFLRGLTLLGLSISTEQGTGRAGAGSAACFDAPSRHELTASGRKVVGSAQWRRAGTVLQHGSLPLAGDVAEVVDYLALEEDRADRLRRLLHERAATVESLLGVRRSFDEVTSALLAGFAEVLAIDWVEGALTDGEQQRADELVQTRYGTIGWNQRV